MSKKRIVIKEEDWKESVHSTKEWEESVTINKWEHDYMKGEYIIDYISSDTIIGPETPKSNTKKVSTKKIKIKKITNKWFEFIINHCVEARENYIKKGYSKDSFEVKTLNETIEKRRLEKKQIVNLMIFSIKYLHLTNNLNTLESEVVNLLGKYTPEHKLEIRENSLRIEVLGSSVSCLIGDPERMRKYSTTLIEYLKENQQRYKWDKTKKKWIVIPETSFGKYVTI